MSEGLHCMLLAPVCVQGVWRFQGRFVKMTKQRCDAVMTKLDVGSSRLQNHARALWVREGGEKARHCPRESSSAEKGPAPRCQI